MSVHQRPVADAVAGIGYECLLCGGHAHAYSGDDGQTVEVWDLCRNCNAAFHFLAVGLQLLEETAPAGQLTQVAGQLELADFAQDQACLWAHGPVAQLNARGLCSVCAEDEERS